MLIEFECLAIGPLLTEENAVDSKAVFIRHKDGKVWVTGQRSAKRPKASKVEDLDPTLLPLEMDPSYLMDADGTAERVQVRVQRAKEYDGKEIFFSFVRKDGA